MMATVCKLALAQYPPRFERTEYQERSWFARWLLDAGGMRLIEAGNVNGARKAIDRDLHITGMALGDSELFDWLADQPTVVLRCRPYPRSQCHCSIDNFVSINSAVEVDLFGQVNAEYAGGKQIWAPAVQSTSCAPPKRQKAGDP